MSLSRRRLMGASLLTAAAPMGRSFAQSVSKDTTIRIGVLEDMSGPYRDITGPTSVVCTQQAIREFRAANPDIAVELVSADHQNKPDVGLGIVREWFDQSGVDAVVGVSNSALAIAMKSVVEEKDKLHLNTSAASSALTSEYCSPNSLHWGYDTWCLAHATGGPLVRQGLDTWFFITPNYAFGKMFQSDVTDAVTAAGGKIIGGVSYPFPETTDFSAFFLQAQSSGAKAIAFTGAGNDFVNCVKQAHEFGLTMGNTTFVGFSGYINSVVALGLPVAQGLTEAETFYWDLNDRTRAFTARVRPYLSAGTLPCQNQAGSYAAVLHYLKAAKAMGPAKAKASGRATMAAMKATPTDDDCFGAGSIRADGRVIHPSYLFGVKSPAESKYPGDLYKVLATTPTDKAFRPISEGRCAMVHT
ncbi:MAG: ABC transporter substrate-binding protein [Rhodopila sp.]|nr:ABC transporter substrate-binding protein [Rhodopila sp.]